jgi:hypothetical protein
MDPANTSTKTEIILKEIILRMKKGETVDIISVKAEY